MRVLTLLKMRESGLGEPPAEMFTGRWTRRSKAIDASFTIDGHNGLLPTAAARSSPPTAGPA